MSHNRRVSLLAPALVLSALLLSASPGYGVEQTVLIPRGTVIPILVTKEVRVGGEGDSQTKKVVFEVAADVIVNHFVIAKKGDTVEGHMTTAKNTTRRLFSSNSSSEVALDVDDIVNFCGDTIHMKFERTLVGGSRSGLLSVYTGTHAHDAVFDKGIVLKASTDRVEKKICAEYTDIAESTLPPGMMVPDEEVPAPNQ
jgi:hypothetical protein